MAEDKLGKMEQEAFKRKERLKALKRNADKSNDSDDPASSKQETHKKPKFRSYMPQDETIKENAILAETGTEDIELAVQSQLELLQTPIAIDEVDIANLAPRKPDWDLKRDVSKKLEKLEHRTQRAIAELIRDRLRKNQENLLDGVNVAMAALTDGSKLQHTATVSTDEN